MCAHWTIAQAKQYAKLLTMSFRKTSDGEYRVNFSLGSEETAYYTTDMRDAITTMERMYHERAAN